MVDSKVLKTAKTKNLQCIDIYGTGSGSIHYSGADIADFHPVDDGIYILTTNGDMCMHFTTNYLIKYNFVENIKDFVTNKWVKNLKLED